MNIIFLVPSGEECGLVSRTPAATSTLPPNVSKTYISGHENLQDDNEANSWDNYQILPRANINNWLRSVYGEFVLTIQMLVLSMNNLPTKRLMSADKENLFSFA